MRRGIVPFVIALGVAGCASIQAVQTRETEGMLADAGFQMRAADTPEAVAHLQTLPPRTLLSRSQSGEPQYAYADPTGCNCVYVGTEEQYQRFLRLQRDQATAVQRRRDAETRDAFYGLWRGVWPPPLQ